LLEIAQHLAAQKAEGKVKLRHDILFAAWTGEEFENRGQNLRYPHKYGRPSH
jgi:hypothetical protein